jgi:hypothetical protein
MISSGIEPTTLYFEYVNAINVLRSYKSQIKDSDKCLINQQTSRNRVHFDSF